MPVIAIRPAKSFVVPSLPTGGTVTDTAWNNLQNTMTNLHQVGYTACTAYGAHVNGARFPVLGYNSGTGHSISGAQTFNVPFILVPGYNRFSLYGDLEFHIIHAMTMRAYIVRSRSRYKIYELSSAFAGTIFQTIRIDGQLPFAVSPGGIEQAYLSLEIEPDPQAVGQGSGVFIGGRPGWGSARLSMYKKDGC